MKLETRISKSLLENSRKSDIYVRSLLEAKGYDMDKAVNVFEVNGGSQYLYQQHVILPLVHPDQKIISGL